MLTIKLVGQLDLLEIMETMPPLAVLLGRRWYVRSERLPGRLAQATDQWAMPIGH